MNKLCPISRDLINEKVARGNATICVLTLIVYILTGIIWLPLVLAIDFLLRGFFPKLFSPIRFLSNTIVRALSLKPKKINAGPKYFAAQVGFVFSLSIFTAAYLNSYITAISITSVLLVFSALEGFAGLCVACKLYPIIRSLFGKEPEYYI